MKNGLQFFTRGGVGENNFGEFTALEFSVRGNQMFPKGVRNFRERGLDGLDEFVRESIGVHDARAKLQQKTGGGGFSHPHAAGQTAEFHFN